MSNSEVRYPMVELDLVKFRNNVDQAVRRCGELGIGLAGVIKGFTGIPEGAKQLRRQAVTISHPPAGTDPGCIDTGSKPLHLIRVPMLSDIEEAVRITDTV